MLKRLYVDNYRSLVNFELNFLPLTFLAGGNGSGKSSVLNIIFALRELLSGSAKVIDPEIFPSSSLTRWQNQCLQVFELDVEIKQGSFCYRLEIEHDPAHKRARILLESLTFGGRTLFSFASGDVRLYRDDHSEGPTYRANWHESALARVGLGRDNEKLTAFRDYFDGIGICSLLPRSFKADSNSEDPILHRDGANFASWYRHVLQENPRPIVEFHDMLRELIPGLQELKLERVGSDTRALLGVFERNGCRYDLKLDELSDGQRILLALYGLLLFSKRGQTLLLDEPENFVSLPEIQPWLMELSDRSGVEGFQVILASHHPEVMDYLGVGCGLLLKQEVSGVTQVRRLTDLANEEEIKLSELLARGWD